MFGLAEQVERSPLPGGLVDGELRLLDFRACRVKDMRPEVEQARFVFARYAVCRMMTVSPGCTASSECARTTPCCMYVFMTCGLWMMGPSMTSLPELRAPVFLEGLIELAQGKPHPHAKPRRFGAQYCCHTFSSMLSLD